MTNDPYDRGLDIFRDSEADEDLRTDGEVFSSDPASNGTRQYPVSGAGQAGLDDSASTPATSDRVSESSALGSKSYDFPTGNGGAAGVKATAGHTVAKAGDVAGSAAAKAGDVAGSAAEKAGELKDVAVERGGDVAAVAKDELARLARDARTEVQSLWSNASGQLQSQAATGQQQLSELLHSLSGELGEMASKSENTGPLTALARQAAAKGGEWSHMLANSEPADVLMQVRRFARRRPFVFLAGAALAGVVVGRLGRGLMASAEHDDAAPTRLASDPTASVTAGVTSPPPVSYEEVPSFGSGEAPEQSETYGAQATADDPYGVRGGAR